MRTSGRAAVGWALLLAACGLAAPAPAPRRAYCERADVAWRAYRAPAAFEAHVLSLARDAASVRVRRVLRRQAHWPRDDAVIRLKLPQNPLECTGRFEVPLKIQRDYIVFAERRGHSAVALGPPLKKDKNLIRRIRAVYKPGYSSGADGGLSEVVAAAKHDTGAIATKLIYAPFMSGQVDKEMVSIRVMMDFGNRTALSIDASSAGDSQAPTGRNWSVQ
ncbi:hypothetical protein ACJJTC_001034 [Scirpophaga incertulas]